MSRRDRWVLAAILAAGLLRGLYWVAVTPVPGPVDELHHLAYVDSLSSGRGIPHVADDLLPADLLAFTKASPTGQVQGLPASGPPSDPSWGAHALQYEGHQPPLYYALLAGPLALAGDLDPAAATALLRVVSLLLALLAVPAAWLLARAALPHTPRAWLLAPGLLVFVQGFNANTAAISNDALVPAAAAAVLVPVARATRHGLTARCAVVTGALMGAALLVKGTTAGVVPLIAIALVAVLVARTATWRQVLTWGALAVVTAGLLVAPWVAYNVLAYPDASAARIVFERITVFIQPPLAFGSDAVRIHFFGTVAGFWDSQLVPQAIVTAPRVLLFGAVALAGIAGVVLVARGHGREQQPAQGAGLWTTRPRVAARGPTIPSRGAAASEQTRRASRADGLALAWLAAALPAAFVVHLVIVYAAAFGGTITLGRLLYAALVPSLVAVAGALALLLGRWATAAAAAIVVVLTFAEVVMIPRFVGNWYHRGVVPPALAPVVEQPWNDRWIAARPIRLDPGCPAELAAVLVEGADAPATAEVQNPGGSTATAPLHSTVPGAGGSGTLARYAVPASAALFIVTLPGTVRVGSADDDRSPRVAFVDGVGDPVASAYCPVPDAEGARFAQRFDYGHLPLPQALVLRWPLPWAGLAVLAALAALLGAARQRINQVSPRSPGRCSRYQR